LFKLNRSSKKKQTNQVDKKPSKTKNPEEKLAPPFTQVEVEEEEEIEKDEVSGIYPIGYRLLHKRVKFLFPKFRPLEEKLSKAANPVPYEVYVCGITFMSLIAAIVGVAMGTVLALMINVNPPAFKFVLPVVFGIAALQATFGIMYMMPKMSVSGRSKKIAEEMPYFMGYMATLSSSGLTLEGIFKEIAKENTKEELVKTCKTIARDIDIFGMDIITAIREAISKSPSEPWTELLEGLISSVQSGGNLSEYFTETAKAQMEEKKLMMQKMTENLGIVAEMYTILLVVFPLMAIIMLAIMAIMTSGFMGFDTVTVMKLITYMLVPIFGIMLLLMMDSMVPKR